MYCPNCNKQYPKDTVFCSLCGGTLEEPAHMQRDSAENSVEYAPKKPKRLKKILLIVLCCTLVIGLIAGGLYYFLVYNHPINKLTRAVENSIEELMANTPTLEEAYHNVRDLLQDREFTAKLDFTESKSWSDGDSRRSSGKVTLNYDAGSEEMSGSLSTEEYRSYGDDINSDSYNIDFSADDDDIYLRAKEVGRDVYSLPLADFGEQYKKSALSDMIEDEQLDDILSVADINPYMEISLMDFLTDTEEGERFMDSLEIEEVDEDIPHAQKDLTVYRVYLEMDELQDAMIGYYKYTVANALGEDAVDEIDWPNASHVSGKAIVYWGINDDDCLVAIHGYEKGNEDDAFTIALVGEENIWDEIVFYEGSYCQKFFVEQKSDGFELYLEHDDRSPEKIFDCDDGAGELIIYDGTTRKYVLSYDSKDGGADFALDYSYFYEDDYDYGYSYTEELHIDLAIVPVEDIEMLDDDPIAVMDLSRKKLEDLLDAIEEAYD